ncbi:MAG: hypothetical protein VW687_09270 [Curvibacter sp.]|jgi:hypothetical protein|tara:strand:+ start:2519 stop:2971 length:453 start_codon:yes stop_codon:yes gene_type:complete
MKHWNYRVIEFAADGDEPAWRELREVYYDDAGRPSAYGAVAMVAWGADEEPTTPHSILERMREALGKPFLDARDFEAERRPTSETTRASYTLILRQDPESDDLVLPLPKILLREQDWRIGDRLKFEVISEGRCSLTNLSKEERDASGRTT